MAKDFMSDEQVEMEIERLLASEDVALAKKEIRIKYKRRQYMYGLRNMEKRGKQLASMGVNMDNMEYKLFGGSIEESEE